MLGKAFDLLEPQFVVSNKFGEAYNLQGPISLVKFCVSTGNKLLVATDIPANKAGFPPS